MIKSQALYNNPHETVVGNSRFTMQGYTHHTNAYLIYERHLMKAPESKY